MSIEQYDFESKSWTECGEVQCCGGLVEAAESVSSIDTVSAPGLSVWSLVSGSGALQTVFTRVSLYGHHQ